MEGEKSPKLRVVTFDAIEVGLGELEAGDGAIFEKSRESSEVICWKFHSFNSLCEIGELNNLDETHRRGESLVARGRGEVMIK